MHNKRNYCLSSSVVHVSYTIGAWTWKQVHTSKTEKHLDICNLHMNWQNWNKTRNINDSTNAQRRHCNNHCAVLTRLSHRSSEKKQTIQDSNQKRGQLILRSLSTAFISTLRIGLLDYPSWERWNCARIGHLTNPFANRALALSAETIAGHIGVSLRLTICNPNQRKPICIRVMQLVLTLSSRIMQYYQM